MSPCIYIQVCEKMDQMSIVEFPLISTYSENERSLVDATLYPMSVEKTCKSTGLNARSMYNKCSSSTYSQWILFSYNCISLCEGNTTMGYNMPWLDFVFVLLWHFDIPENCWKRRFIHTHYHFSRKRLLVFITM